MECSSREPGTLSETVSLMQAEEAVALAGMASALGDPIRIQMIHLLEQAEEICTCHFQSLLGLSQPKASYHLKILMDAGLVERRVRGTWSHYSLIGKGLLSRLNDIAGEPNKEISGAGGKR